MNLKLKQGDSIKWIDGSRITVKNIRRETQYTYYIFHELLNEYTHDQIFEILNTERTAIKKAKECVKKP